MNIRILKCEVRMNKVAFSSEELVNGKGFIKIPTIEGEYIPLDNAVRATLYPGIWWPEFEESCASFPKEEETIIINVNLSDDDVPVLILWVPVHEWGPMVKKMIEIPLYRVLETNTENSKKRLLWKGRSLGHARRYFSDPVIEYLLKKGIRKGRVVLQQQEGKIWKPIESDIAFFMIFGKTAKIHNRQPC